MKTRGNRWENRNPDRSKPIQKRAMRASIHRMPAPRPNAREKRRFFRWLWILLPAFCLYRVQYFEIRPLDAPGTLRAFLRPFFYGFISSFSSADIAARCFVTICSVLLAVPVALVLSQCFLERTGAPRSRWRRVFCSRRLFFGSVIIALLVCRFPLLFGTPSNPDEDEWLVAAHKLLVDPVAFRSVDQHTSGPLVAFPLDIAALFGFSPDYASARIVSLLLISLSLYLASRTLRLVASESVARSAILPAIVFFAVSTHPDFIHYSSETVPLLLISLAGFACASVIRDPESYPVPLTGLGALVAAGFWAKMQCLPILLVACGFALAVSYRDGLHSFGGPRTARFWRPFRLFIAGMTPLMLPAAAAILIAGAGRDWWFSYIVWNYRFTRSAGHWLDNLKGVAAFLIAPVETQLLLLSLLVVLAHSLYLVFRRRQTRAWAALLESLAIGAGAATLAIHFVPAPGGHGADWRAPGTALLVCGAAMAILIVRDWFHDRKAVWWGVLVSGLLGAGVFSILPSRNLAPHYLLLLIIPVTLTIGWLLSRSKGEVEGLAVAVLCTVTAVGEAAYRLPRLHNIFLSVPPVTAGPEGPLIRKLTPLHQPIVVWGWHGSSYLSSGRIMATRDTHMYPLFCCDTELENRYRERFLRDLRRRPPGLIVDALDVSCCLMNDRGFFGFETVPAIRQYIDAHYVRVAEQFRQRFYLRRDLASLNDVRPCRADALRCYQSGSTANPRLDAFRMPEHLRIEVEFTPLEAGEPAEIVGTQPSTAAGFEFRHAGNGYYRLVAGDAGHRVASEDTALPDGRRVSLAIDFAGTSVALTCNGQNRGQLQLNQSLAGTEQSIAFGTWEGHRYAAALDRLEVVDLERSGR